MRLPRLFAFLRLFASAQRGNVAMVFALALPVVAVLALSLIDYERSRSTRQRMQMAADSAALAAARELVLANSDPTKISAVAQQIAMSNLSVQDMSAVVSASVLTTNDGVQVLIDKDVTSATTALSVLRSGHIQVKAVAHLSGGSTVCLLTLDTGGLIGFGLYSAMLTSPQCGTYSNSASKTGIYAGGTAFAQSGMICSGGGVSSAPQVLKPNPILDCPPLPDPLASRPPPAVGSCNFTNTVITGGTVTLAPGVYCGGLNVTGGNVTLSNGTYIIKDGPMIFKKGSSLTMQNAGVYLTGMLSLMYFDNTTMLKLSAPTAGPMAGILFFEDRSLSTLLRFHYMSSRSADLILGTIYLPRSTLFIGEQPTSGDPVAFNCSVVANYEGPCPPPAANVGSASAWTVIIANHVMINAGVNLVLNANYGVSSVPAPPEIVSKASATAHLSQ